jgi:hypothetical protein
MKGHVCRFIFVTFMVILSIVSGPMKVLGKEGWTKSCTSTISANFNSTPIPGGSSIWFTSALTPAGQLTNPGSGPMGAVYVEDFSVSFTANGTTYNCYNHSPVNIINFSSSTTIPQVTFYQSSNSWITNVPTGLQRNVFLAPCILYVPHDLPGGIQPVTWTMTFKSDSTQPIVWQWGAAVYSQFPPAQEAGCGSGCIGGGETGTRFDEVGAKAADDVPNQYCVNPTGDPFQPGTGTTTCSAPYGDPSGTPEGVNTSNQPWKQFLIGGATGNGGSNWTGTQSPTASCTPVPTS